jgi:hypothetical protein
MEALMQTDAALIYSMEALLQTDTAVIYLVEALIPTDFSLIQSAFSLTPSISDSPVSQKGTGELSNFIKPRWARRTRRRKGRKKG